MKYTFKYERTTFGRMNIVCVDIPQIHTEQLDPSPVNIVQDAYDMLNLYIPIASLIGERVQKPLCATKGNDYFTVNVMERNKKWLL